MLVIFLLLHKCNEHFDVKESSTYQSASSHLSTSFGYEAGTCFVNVCRNLFVSPTIKRLQLTNFTVIRHMKKVSKYFFLVAFNKHFILAFCQSLHPLKTENACQQNFV